MFRYLICLVLLLAVAPAALSATTTVMVNGQAAAVPVIEQGGKAYVDIAALMKILGGKASFDAGSHRLYISSSAGSATASPGTAELAGDNGKMGTVYSMLKGSPLYFSLKSAEYTTKQVVIGDTLYFPAAEEKLLLLHFSVQNPQKTETFIRGDIMKFMAVDAANVNHEGIGTWGDAESHNTVELNLKPAQRIDLYSVIVVPAKGVVPKLMVQPANDNDGPVLRYDLHDVVTALPAPIADPADKTGATALTEVPAQVGAAYPHENFTLTVEKFAYVTTALNNQTPDEGARYLVANLLIKNESPHDSFLRSDELHPEVTDADGAKLTYNDMLFATRDAVVEQNLKPATDLHVRIYFTVPKGSTPASLSLKGSDTGRAFLYDLKDVK